MKWVTRERPKIDRIACPWLVTRFIDREPEFLFVPPGAVLSTAVRAGAIPFDVPGVELSHTSGGCSFDAFLRIFQLWDPALRQLAVIIRGADTGRLDLAPQSAGLLAVSLGLSQKCADDLEVLKQGFVIYDAFYSWAQEQGSSPAARSARRFIRPPPSHRAFALLCEWTGRSRQRRHLQMLDERLLQDIGVTPAQAEAETRKPFWEK